MTKPEAIDSFTEKLAAFAADLSEGEREVLATIVARAKDAPDAEVAGYDISAGAGAVLSGLGGIGAGAHASTPGTAGVGVGAGGTGAGAGASIVPGLSPHVYAAVGASLPGAGAGASANL